MFKRYTHTYIQTLDNAHNSQVQGLNLRRGHIYGYFSLLKDGRINQSINVKFVGRHYTTGPGAPTVVSGKHDQKVHA